MARVTEGQVVWSARLPHLSRPGVVLVAELLVNRVPRAPCPCCALLLRHADHQVVCLEVRIRCLRSRAQQGGVGGGRRGAIQRSSMALTMLTAVGPSTGG